MWISMNWIFADKWDCNAKKCIRFRDVGLLNDRLAQTNITADRSFLAWMRVEIPTRRFVTSELWSHTYECRAELTGFLRCKTQNDTHLTLAATEEIASFLRFFLLDTAVPMLAWKRRLQENSTFQMSKHWRKRVKKMIERVGFGMRILLRSHEGLFVA